MAAVLLIAAAPPAPAPIAPATPCAAAEAERAALKAERVAVDRAISDIALGGAPRARVGGRDVARHAAGTAASMLLPFGLGIAVNAATALAAKARKQANAKAPPPEPDAPALIARADAIDTRLAELKSGCS